MERQLAETERALAGIVRVIEGGAWSDTLRDRLAELETRKVALTAKLAGTETPAPVTLHPAAAEIYRREVADLEVALNDPEIKGEAVEVLRGLIDKIVLIPDEDAPDELRAELHGDLAEILALSDCAAPAGPTAATSASASAGRRKALRSGASEGLGVGSGLRQLSVFARTGFEPVTSRL